MRSKLERLQERVDLIEEVQFGTGICAVSEEEYERLKHELKKLKQQERLNARRMGRRK